MKEGLSNEESELLEAVVDNPKPPIFTLAEVAQRLKVKRHVISLEINEGRLKASTEKGVTTIANKDLEEYIKNQTHNPLQ